jgi:hypothetical protein
MTPVESFIHRENIKNFERRLADRTTDEDQRKMLARLLAEEKVKAQSQNGQSGAKKDAQPLHAAGRIANHILGLDGGTTDEQDLGCD